MKFSLFNNRRKVTLLRRVRNRHPAYAGWRPCVGLQPPTLYGGLPTSIPQRQDAPREKNEEKKKHDEYHLPGRGQRIQASES